MTEHECNEKITELNQKIEELRSEKRKYEDYICEEKSKRQRAEYKAAEGKCFLTKGLRNNKNSHVKAFKVISVLEEPTIGNAECLTVIDETANIARKSIAISRTILPVWKYNQICLRSDIKRNRMIDLYHEISQEEFDSMVNDYTDMILKGES